MANRNRKLQRLARERMKETDERYTVALAKVREEQGELRSKNATEVRQEAGLKKP